VAGRNSIAEPKRKRGNEKLLCGGARTVGRIVKRGRGGGCREILRSRQSGMVKKERRGWGGKRGGGVHKTKATSGGF